MLTEEAARLLRALGVETRLFDPSSLPLPDAEPDNHRTEAELRELAQWAEGMLLTSPERHGAMTGIMNAQIDWIPLVSAPTQGKTLAVRPTPSDQARFRSPKFIALRADTSALGSARAATKTDTVLMTKP